MFENILPSNFILACDTYKFDHWAQYPADTEQIYVVVVPRKPSKYADKIVAMGQTFVAEILANVRITMDMIDEAELEVNQQGYDFNRSGWEYIVKEFGGRLPLQVFAVEEGRIVLPQTPVMGLINTGGKPNAWLPGYVETWVQQIVWKMSTVSSVARACRLTIREYMEATSSSLAGLDWALHNFGDRGADSPEEAPVMAGIGHAALFNGSDCARSNRFIKKMYGYDKAATSSVIATEHSSMCANSDAREKDDFGAALMAVERLEHAVKRTQNGIGVPVVSAVIDTYDPRRFVRDYMGDRLKDRIVNSGGKMVMRPDSGDVLVEPSMVARDIEATFGAPLNSKGYKEFPAYVGEIQGDGVKVTTVGPILKAFADSGFATAGLVLGMGGGITHEGGRDDFSFSMKAIARFDGTRWIPMLKEPKTDTSKKSLTGLVRCRENADGELEVFDALKGGQLHSFLKPCAGWQLWVENGYRVYRQKWDDVRARARADSPSV